MSKRNDALPLGPALLLGLALNVMLGGEYGFPARAGFLAAVPAFLLLCGLCMGFVLGWAQLRACACARRGFALLLVLSAACELLRLCRLYRLAAQPVPAVLLSVLVLLAAVYLRRAPVIAHAAALLLIFLLAGFVLLCAAIAGRLHLENLQTAPLGSGEFSAALCAELRLPAEFLLLALAVQPGRAAGADAAKLAAFSLGLLLAAAALLELFFGAAAGQQASTLHTLACGGVLSVFVRMEWIQVLLWTLAAVLKTGLYLFCAGRLFARQPPPELPLPRYAVLAGCCLVLSVLLQPFAEAAALYDLLDLLRWLFAAAVIFVGGILWLKG